jgi:mono/diheme cytochrome c family protein
MTAHIRLSIAGGLAALLLSAAAADAADTYVKDIAPILNRSCVGCHRPGEAAPMSLIGYENVRPWARSIRQRVSTRQMPPWMADAQNSAAFANDPSLGREEIDRIVRWVDSGAPRGEGAEPAAPPLAPGWSDSSGRAPDYVLTLPVAYTVPASSAGASAGVLNPTFYVKVPFDDDRWMRAVQGRPDQRGVVHYMDLNVVEFPDGAAPPATVVQATGAAVIGSGREIDFLTANYRPGYGYEAFPAGSARRLKGGRQRYFQITMHYEPNGTAVEDRSSFGFWFAAAAPATEIVKAPITAGVITADGKPVFDGANTKAGPTLQTKVYYPMVPANTSRFEVVSVQSVTAPLTIYELLPHAHNRASDFKYTIVFPDGREQVLLTVPRYDETWQFAYRLASPVHVPAGAKIVVVAHYNNSSSNKTVKSPAEPGGDMFMPVMQYSSAVTASR